MHNYHYLNEKSISQIIQDKRLNVTQSQWSEVQVPIFE